MLVCRKPQSLVRSTILLHSLVQQSEWPSTVSSGFSCPPIPSQEDRLRLFFSGFMKNNDTHDSDCVLVSALKSCAILRVVSEGRQLHCVVLKSGLTANVFVQNSVLSMYSKCGSFVDVRSMFGTSSHPDVISRNIMLSAYVKFDNLDCAHQLFEEMPDRSSVSYTTMIMGFSQGGRWMDAIRLFDDMRRHEPFIPNEVTMASVISAYSHLNEHLHSRPLHGLSIKLDLQGSVYVSTNLVYIYTLSSSLQDARALFDGMPERSLVSWNAMLNGYAKAGLVNPARNLFDEIPTRDVVSWGTMLNGYLRAELLAEAFSLFREMLRTRSSSPSDLILVDLLSACARREVSREGQQLHCMIINRGFACTDFIQATIIHFYGSSGMIESARRQFECGVTDHIPSSNALITAYARNGMMLRARKAFDAMLERDVFTWSAIISGYAQSGHPDTTLELFKRMVRSGVRPNEVTMASVFSAIAALGSLPEAELALECMRRNSIPLSDNVSAAMIDMYAKCGGIADALDLFYSMRDAFSTVSPWNAIICGLAMHGDALLSIRIFDELVNRGLRLSSITFMGVLTACCHAGLVDDGERCFRIMKECHGVEPELKHYGCVIDLLGRSGRLIEAEEMIQNMPVEPDVIIWGTLLAACRKHGNVEIGERAAENLRRLDTSHGASRVLLSNLYADMGRWDDAVSVRKTMHVHQMQRSPGYSELI